MGDLELRATRAAHGQPHTSGQVLAKIEEPPRCIRFHARDLQLRAGKNLLPPHRRGPGERSITIFGASSSSSTGCHAASSYFADDHAPSSRRAS